MKEITLALCITLLPLSTLAAVSGLPNRSLTPGATNPGVTQQNLRKTICRHGYTRTIRPSEHYTEALKHLQIRQYGYADRHIWDYEEDHLVPLEVGGAPADPKNLWPEPRYGEWSARMKDRLENKVDRMVCQGRMTLRRGQAIFERNWEAGYRRYVRQ